MTPQELEPGLFVKGAAVRNCQTAADVVAARFEGFVPAGDQTAETTDYRDLQEQAKVLEVPANQSTEALVEAIAAVEPTNDQETE